MKIKIVIEVKSNDKQQNTCQGKFIKDGNLTSVFSINKDEVKKLVDWGFLVKSDNSNDKDYYIREFEV
jgi:hypothetical protein